MHRFVLGRKVPVSLHERTDERPGAGWHLGGLGQHRSHRPGHFGRRQRLPLLRGRRRHSGAGADPLPLAQPLVRFLQIPLVPPSAAATAAAAAPAAAAAAAAAPCNYSAALTCR